MSAGPMKPAFRVMKGGFTLVELLVVIAIIGILMSLLLPAVNAVRETARRTQCRNNLYQIGKAMTGHVATTGHFPSSGWGYLWTGDPDRGYGVTQPGGWIYNILPFMGMSMIHDVGKGTDANTKPGALAAAIEAQMPNFLCPTRRKVVVFPNPAQQTAFNTVYTPTMNKTDYASNGGTNRYLGTGPSISCLTSYPSCNWSNDTSAFNGVSGERSEVKSAQLTDGAANTFFAGEKYLNPDDYYTANDGADNNSNLVGNDWDVNRWGNSSSWLPGRDTKGYDSCSTRFGSAHSVGLNFVYCDEHVRMINFTIDPNVYQSLCQRNYAATYNTPINENY